MMGEPRLDYLFHHVFLPAQLPSRNDTQSGQGDQALVDLLLESIEAFRAANDHAYYQTWSVMRNPYPRSDTH